MNGIRMPVAKTQTGTSGYETTFRRTLRTPIENHGDKAAQAFLTWLTGDDGATE